MTSDPWKDLGYSIRQARLDQGWTLEQLAAEALGNGARKGYVSQVEKGLRNLSPETIDKFDQALDLPAEVVKSAHLAPPPQKAAPETEQVDRDAERLIRRATSDTDAPPAAEALLIALAYEFARGSHIDLQTAYNGLRAALLAAENIRQRGEMPDNTGGQLQNVLAEVARLNDAGDRDEADALLEAEEQRQRAEEKAIKERLDEQARQLLDRRLDQDRLRNDPHSAAQRLIRDLHRQAPPGGVWNATGDLLIEWRKRGEKQGAPFDLRVALALAKANYEKARKPVRFVALDDLGNCHLAIGKRAMDTRHLIAAEKAYRAVLKLLSKRRDPQNWAGTQNNLGEALRTLGERAQDDRLLRDAVTAYEAALTIRKKDTAPMDWATTQNNLGIALRNMGDRAQDDTLLREAITAFEAALTVQQKDTAPMDWAMTQNNLGTALQTLGVSAQDDRFLRDAVTAYEAALTVWKNDTAPMDWAGAQNNLGLALRWRGTVTQQPEHFDKAEAAFLRCLEEFTQDAVPFLWASTQWNLGDLALAWFELDPDSALLDTAEGHVHAARAIFAEGSDHQTDRCDELLAKIAQARAGLSNGSD